MKYYYYYDRSGSRCWWGYWMDNDGNQIGEAVYASTSELVLIELGRVYTDRIELSQKIKFKK